MNVLITGGSGLIAGRLADYIKSIHNVTLVSRSKVNPIDQVKILIAHELDSQTLQSQDIIIHAASPNHHQCNDDKIREKYLKTTKKLINDASQNNVKKFIFTSSTRIYGRLLNGNISEETDLSIEDNYSLVKKEIEDYLQKVSLSSGLTAYSLRLSNSYGYPIMKKTQCWDLVVMYACKQAFIDNKIALRSNGEEYKDFIPVSAVAETINNIIMIKDKHKYGVYNITSGNTEKIKNILNYLTDRIYHLNKKQVKLILSSSQEKYTQYQIHNALNSIKCAPVINHVNEMDMLIKYCKKNYL